MGNKQTVLFLCTGNSARSQMAEALLRSFAGDRFEVHSAGLAPRGLHPCVAPVLEEIGVKSHGNWSKNLDRYLGKKHFRYLITVCAQAEKNCPTVFPGIGEHLHWPFDDPAAVRGSREEQMEVFRRVRDEIAERIRSWASVKSSMKTDETGNGRR